eukprot:5172670-Pleurochrysis_carterae.AAC.1
MYLASTIYGHGGFTGLVLGQARPDLFAFAQRELELRAGRVYIGGADRHRARPERQPNSALAL